MVRCIALNAFAVALLLADVASAEVVGVCLPAERRVEMLGALRTELGATHSVIALCEDGTAMDDARAATMHAEHHVDAVVWVVFAQATVSPPSLRVARPNGVSESPLSLAYDMIDPRAFAIAASGLLQTAHSAPRDPPPPPTSLAVSREVDGPTAPPPQPPPRRRPMSLTVTHMPMVVAPMVLIGGLRINGGHELAVGGGLRLGLALNGGMSASAGVRLLSSPSSGAYYAAIDFPTMSLNLVSRHLVMYAGLTGTLSLALRPRVGVGGQDGGFGLGFSVFVGIRVPLARGWSLAVELSQELTWGITGNLDKANLLSGGLGVHLEF